MENGSTKFEEFKKLPLRDLNSMKHNIHKNHNTLKLHCNHCRQKGGRNVVNLLNVLKKNFRVLLSEKLTDKRIFLLFQGSSETADLKTERHRHGLQCKYSLYK